MHYLSCKEWWHKWGRSFVIHPLMDLQNDLSWYCSKNTITVHIYKYASWIEQVAHVLYEVNNTPNGNGQIGHLHCARYEAVITLLPVVRCSLIYKLFAPLIFEISTKCMRKWGQLKQGIQPVSFDDWCQSCLKNLAYLRIQIATRSWFAKRRREPMSA